jgi:hypothetical protein
MKTISAPKCGQGKTIIDLFRNFYKIANVQVTNFIPVKVAILYMIRKFYNYKNIKQTFQSIFTIRNNLPTILK